MLSLLKEIILFFVLVVFTNLGIDFVSGVEQYSLLQNPQQYLGTSAVVSLFMGVAIFWIKRRSPKKESVEKA